MRDVSLEHLPRYASEAVFRWNGRRWTTTERLAAVLGNGAARRLPYRALLA